MCVNNSSQFTLSGILHFSFLIMYFRVLCSYNVHVFARHFTENTQETGVTLDMAYKKKLQIHLTLHRTYWYSGNAPVCILQSISNLFEDIGYLEVFRNSTSATLRPFLFTSFLAQHSPSNCPAIHTTQSKELTAS